MKPQYTLRVSAIAPAHHSHFDRWIASCDTPFWLASQCVFDSYAQYVDRLQEFGIDEVHLVVADEIDTPVGLLRLKDIWLQHGNLAVDAYLDEEHRVHPYTTDLVPLVAETLMYSYPLHKLTFQHYEGHDVFGVGRWSEFLEEEGRLVNHVIHRGAGVDVVLFALRREGWSTMQRQLGNDQ